MTTRRRAKRRAPYVRPPKERELFAAEIAAMREQIVWLTDELLVARLRNARVEARLRDSGAVS